MNGVGDFKTISSEVESLLGAFGIAQVDDGSEEHPFAPNNRTRPTPSGDVGFPGHVFGAGPSFGEVGVLGNAT